MYSSDMISIDEARDRVLQKVEHLEAESLGILESLGRVCAVELKSDIDVAPFAHSAMDGYALRSSQIANASENDPVPLEVVGEIPAGSVFADPIPDNSCVRIMTGAELPQDCDTVVKYEIVDILEGDGKTGSTVAFNRSAKVGDNVRAAGEEAKAGETILKPGDIISNAGAGYLASCGILELEVFRRPRIAIIPTGSELVPADRVPGPGHIRESNGYAIAASALACGAIPTMLPIVKDTYDDLYEAIDGASDEYDFVITTGGAANGDYDYTKSIADELGEVIFTQVNMRPGKAQTFAMINGTPFFGLPGNPAAAYCGFEMLIRPALRKMQGFSEFSRPFVKATLTEDIKKKDPRAILMRSTLSRDETNDVLLVTPAKNQSSGLFGVIQKSNCFAILPEGLEDKSKGDIVECMLIDVNEEIII